MLGSPQSHHFAISLVPLWSNLHLLLIFSFGLWDLGFCANFDFYILFRWNRRGSQLLFLVLSLGLYPSKMDLRWPIKIWIEFQKTQEKYTKKRKNIEKIRKLLNIKIETVQDKDFANPMASSARYNSFIGPSLFL